MSEETADELLGRYLGAEKLYPCRSCGENPMVMSRAEWVFGKPYVCPPCWEKFLKHMEPSDNGATILFNGWKAAK